MVFESFYSRYLLFFYSIFRSSGLVEDVCRNASPQLYKLAAYLISYHRSFADVLQEQIMRNMSSLEIESLFEVLDRIETVAIIDERIYENIRKLHLSDFTQILSAADGLWLQKKYRKWTEKIMSQLSKTFGVDHVFLRNEHEFTVNFFVNNRRSRNEFEDLS